MLKINLLCLFLMITIAVFWVKGKIAKDQIHLSNKLHVVNSAQKVLVIPQQSINIQSQNNLAVNDSYSVDTTEVTTQFNYQQLEQMIYSSELEQQLLALDLLLDFGEKSLPLLLYLINSETEIAVQELAISSLSSLPLPLDELDIILSSMAVQSPNGHLLHGIANLPDPIYISPYQHSTLLSELDKDIDIYQQLKASDEDERRLGLLKIDLLDSDLNRQILTEVLKFDESEQIRKEVYIKASSLFSEFDEQWATLALEDSSKMINFFGIDLLENIPEHIEEFIPQLAQVIYSTEHKEVKEKAIDFLMKNYTLAGDTILKEVIDKETYTSR